MIEKMVSDADCIIEDIILKPIRIVERISTAAFATKDKEIQKAVMFIYHNRHKKISVKDVVSNVALSRRLLEVRFKEVTGQSIYQYIADLKIKTFSEMLLETDDQVINIALSLGENDAKSISKRFKATYGRSPNEWRSRHGKKD
jgi:LacI family transcriptional regulator